MAAVVSNTGPILHLTEIDAVSLLSEMGEVHVPPVVESEVAARLADWQSIKPAWLHVVPLQSDHEEKAKNWIQSGIIHAGEAGAIALVEQINANMLFTDDSAARFFANSRGLEVHGSLGIVLHCAACGGLSQEDAWGCLDRLGKSSLWISKRVLHAAHDALEKIFR